MIFIYYVGEVKIVSGEATALPRFEQRYIHTLILCQCDALLLHVSDL